MGPATQWIAFTTRAYSSGGIESATVDDLELREGVRDTVLEVVARLVDVRARHGPDVYDDGPEEGGIHHDNDDARRTLVGEPHLRQCAQVHRFGCYGNVSSDRWADFPRHRVDDSRPGSVSSTHPKLLASMW